MNTQNSPQNRNNGKTQNRRKTGSSGNINTKQNYQQGNTTSVPKRNNPTQGRSQKTASPKQQATSSPLSQQQQLHTNLHDSQTQKDRLYFLFVNLVGQTVEVQLVNDKVYEGVFHTIQVPEFDSGNKNSSFAIVLNSVRVKHKSLSSTIQQFPVETLIIKDSDIVHISAIDIVFATEKEQYRGELFAIDSEISKKKDVVERELIPWMPNGGDDMDTEFEELESKPHTEKGWDQYKENQKFGVSTTYDEKYYTTELDKSSQFYKQYEKEAERIAQEIENVPNKNVSSLHILEERGMVVESELTEEELYSSVARSTIKTSHSQQVISTFTSNGVPKYIPPPIKAKMLEQQQQQQEEQLRRQGKSKLQKNNDSKQQQTRGTENNKNSLDSGSPVLEHQGSYNFGHRNSLSGSPSMLSDNDSRMFERMRLRQHLVKGKSNSPSLTPLGTPSSPRSPILSTSPSGRISGLSLDPATPKVSEEVVDDFSKFKETKENTKEKEINDLKNFCQSLKDVPSSPPESKTFILSKLKSKPFTGSAPVSRSSSPTVMLGRQAQAPEKTKGFEGRDKTQIQEKVPASTVPTSENIARKPEGSAAKNAEISQKPPSSSPAAIKEQQGEKVDEKTNAEKPKKEFKFNPSAKAFNPNAKSFVPGKPFRPLSAQITSVSTLSSWSAIYNIDVNEPIKNSYNQHMTIKIGTNNDSRSLSHTWQGLRKSYKDEAKMAHNMAIPPPQQYIPTPIPPTHGHYNLPYAPAPGHMHGGAHPGMMAPYRSYPRSPYVNPFQPAISYQYSIPSSSLNMMPPNSQSSKTSPQPHTYSSPQRGYYQNLYPTGNYEAEG